MSPEASSRTTAVACDSRVRGSSWPIACSATCSEHVASATAGWPCPSRLQLAQLVGTGGELDDGGLEEPPGVAGGRLVGLDEPLGLGPGDHVHDLFGHHR